MAISKYPSKLSLPQVNPGVASVYEYLLLKFKAIPADVWRERICSGKVHWHDGSLIGLQTPFKPQQRVYYYREVSAEPAIPFNEQILFQDQHLLVAYKPHFLQVTPSGRFIDECLQNRLRQKTGFDQLQALHRLDRPTAGIVIFAINQDARQHYHGLFEHRQVQKSYQAIAKVPGHLNLTGQHWEVSNRLEQSAQRFRMQIVPGEPNSHSYIHCSKQCGDYALFELKPVTGKTHQLRLHMQTIGYPILNDALYPKLKAYAPECYDAPLQLLAKEIEFIDPLTGAARTFRCAENLTLIPGA